VVGGGLSGLSAGLDEDDDDVVVVVVLILVFSGCSIVVVFS